ncbi:MAG TPA: class II glutamine amidotransferase [Nevskiaceae bacterium]|nr:class II glutamine amidotransferase [Nevskiaceae bacterium]
MIYHKPAGVALPEPLLLAGLSLNRDGWGIMGFDPAGRLILERETAIDRARLLHRVRLHRDAELVVHLRQITRGGSHEDNAHPLEIGNGVYLMHQGTLPLETLLPGRSDTWHFGELVLGPLLERDPGLVSDPALHRLLELALREQNRMVLLSTASRKIQVLNRRLGVEVEGVWISSPRWVDQRLYPIADATPPQERSVSAESVHFF